MSEAAVPFLRMNLFVLFFLGDSVVPFDGSLKSLISVGSGCNVMTSPCILGVQNAL